jgi:hypothetical protein
MLYLIKLMILSEHHIAQGPTAISGHVNHDLFRNGGMVVPVGVVELHPRLKGLAEVTTTSIPAPQICTG